MELVVGQMAYEKVHSTKVVAIEFVLKDNYDRDDDPVSYLTQHGMYKFDYDRFDSMGLIQEIRREVVHLSKSIIGLLDI